MPLVDYSSDSDGSASASGSDHQRTPPKKKARTASPHRRAGSGRSPNQGSGSGSGSGPGPRSGPGSQSGSGASLPPLPAAFYDLYASTVRTTTRDDPALHQGRTRQIPHVPGNWPSHIYIEWHPPADVHAVLSELVSELQTQARAIIPGITASTAISTNTSSSGSGSGSGNASPGVEITSFLLSDLAAPLPLHISLSRPLALPTESKDAFLREAERAVRASGLSPFALRCGRAEWHRTGESARSFLVLRVRSDAAAAAAARHGSSSSSSITGARGPSCTSSSNRRGGGGHDDTDADAEAEAEAAHNPNPELTTLLRRCNSLAAHHGQPVLYQWADDNDNDKNNDNGDGGDRNTDDAEQTTSKKRRSHRGAGTQLGVGDAFHVSIAWSFAEPTAELASLTERIFARAEARDLLRRARIPVEGVKVKIGNAVTHVALPEPGRRRNTRGGRGRGGGTEARNLLGL